MSSRLVFATFERLRVLACLMALALASAWKIARAEPFALERPEFLNAPAVSRAASGITYSYLGTSARRAARLQITLAEVPAAAPDADAKACASAFLGTLEQQYRGFLAVPDTAVLPVGELALEAWRWSGQRGKDFLTGVVACRRVDARFLVITFQDTLRSAPETFTVIRARLSALEFE